MGIESLIIIIIIGAIAGWLAGPDCRGLRLRAHWQYYRWYRRRICGEFRLQRVGAFQ